MQPISSRLGPWSDSVEDENRRMLRARDAMDRDFAQPLDVRRLSKIAHVSGAHFIRSFKATFGETPHRYLQRRRIERAMYLLRTTDRSVTDICMDVGFASLGTFSRTFTTSWARRRQRSAVGARCRRCRRASSRRGRDRAVSEKRPEGGPRTVARMYQAISRSSVFVLDQDEAVDFYVNKLGLEVSTDQDLGFMRWLTVRVPGDPVREILLERPGPPAMDDEAGTHARGHGRVAPRPPPTPGARVHRRPTATTARRGRCPPTPLRSSSPGAPNRSVRRSPRWPSALQLLCGVPEGNPDPTMVAAYPILLLDAARGRRIVTGPEPAGLLQAGLVVVFRAKARVDLVVPKAQVGRFSFGPP